MARKSTTEAVLPILEKVEDQPKLFEPFARLRGSGVKEVGLGLVVCKRLVEAHGGHIWIDSQPGQGSIFLFNIPEE